MSSEPQIHHHGSLADVGGGQNQFPSENVLLTLNKSLQINLPGQTHFYLAKLN